MKQTILLLGTILGLFSCSKNEPAKSNGNSGNFGGQNNGSQVSSLALYSPSSKNLIKYTFAYDANGSLSRLSYSSYDTIGGVAALDTGSYYFIIDPTSHLASSYTLIWSRTNAGAASETHNLFFDDQKRLIKDTLVNDQGNPTSFYFNYSANGILSHGYTMYAYDSINKIHGWGVSGIDSITLVNANIASQYEYAQSGAYWGMSYSYVVRNYSAYPNPLYGLNQSSGLGALLRNYNSLDCVSKSLPADGMSGWTADGNSRIVSGLATDGTITTYTYQ
jgi:hypothetical protein